MQKRFFTRIWALVNQHKCSFNLGDRYHKKPGSLRKKVANRAYTSQTCKLFKGSTIVNKYLCIISLNVVDFKGLVTLFMAFVKHSIAMVSDYFYPNTGGIETHIFELSKALIKLGHKVIIVTHKYPGCPPVQHIGKLKIYYLNIPVFHMNTVFPGFFTNFFLIVDILRKEEIEIVHGHQSMSSLCYEALLHAQTLNIKSVFTDHSLFESGALENILVNRISRFVLKGVDRSICVSYSLKENLMERTQLGSNTIHVVPNAISDNFRAVERTKSDKIVIASSCRFVYRKGIELLIKAIPKVCDISEKIEFLIIGDGPKRDQLEQMIDEHNLKERVTLLGLIRHENICNILKNCDIFLNTSLTESFCMAITEAAACGLQVVSTNVGAVREVLPPEMITLVGLDENEVARGIGTAIEKMRQNNRKAASQKIKSIYSWIRVAREVEDIYNLISSKQDDCVSKKLFDRLQAEKETLCVYFRILIVIDYIFFFVYKAFRKV